MIAKVETVSLDYRCWSGRLHPCWTRRTEQDWQDNVWSGRNWIWFYPHSLG